MDFFNIFRNLGVDAKKAGYERAANEYKSIYRDIEQQYQATINIFENRTLNQSERLNVLIDRLSELEEKRNKLREKFKRKSNEKIPLNASAALMFPIGTILLYDLLEREGYVESKQIFEEKIEKLKSELNIRKASISHDLQELSALADEVCFSIMVVTDEISDIKEKLLELEYGNNNVKLSSKNKNVMTSREFRKKKIEILSKVEDDADKLQKGSVETTRVTNIISDTKGILDDLDEQFCNKTGLTKIDMNFLFLAVGLQIARQYLVTSFPKRLDDQIAAKRTKGHGIEHSNRQHKYYSPSLEEIITNPVPFDANIGADGALSGGGRLGHRSTAIGHDPILGLIFGTANIATSTLTTWDLKSYHIGTNNAGRDFFKNNARTDLVLGYTLDKMCNQGLEGMTIVATSLIKELIHLKSDVHTKNSLPLPIVSSIDPKLASTLANYGLDMSNILTAGKQASLAILINTLIAMLHRLLYTGMDEQDRKLYEVRTRKILSYSGVVATSTNLAVVAVTKKFEKLDLGGLVVNVYRLITDSVFIREVKEEFIFGTFKNMILDNSWEN